MSHAWPHAVFEGAVREGEEPLRLDRPFPVRQLAEIFVYRDVDSYMSWKDSGLTTTNGDAVVYVALEPDAIAFVVDDRDSPAGIIVQDLVVALKEMRSMRKSSVGRDRARTLPCSTRCSRIQRR